VSDDLDDDLDEDAFVAALDRFEQALFDGDRPGAMQATAEAEALADADEPEVLFCRARLALADDALDEATSLLQRVIALDDAHADAHHLLARLAEARGDRATMIAHFHRVRVLDAKSDRAANLGRGGALDHIERVAHEVLAALPEPWGRRLADVPIVLERHPSRALVDDGFDPRSLGLFEGRMHGDEVTPAPSRIVLYTCNLLADFPEGPELDAQIEITLLHEIGHFFGLEEHDMQRLGLD
jgi:predicted Zn-dependent protease with MMP-like domain